MHLTTNANHDNRYIKVDVNDRCESLSNSTVPNSEKKLGKHVITFPRFVFEKEQDRKCAYAILKRVLGEAHTNLVHTKPSIFLEGLDRNRRKER